MKNKLILAVAALALIGAGVWYFGGRKPAGPGKMTGAGGQKSEEFSGTLVQAMKLGMPMKCEWSSGDGSGESYVKGNDVYVKTQVQGKTGMMVKKGDCVYTWGEAEKQGVKFCQMPTPAPESEESSPWQPDSGSFQAEGVDWNVEYKCRPDIFSGNRFDLPQDVQFSDLGSMLQNALPSLPALPDLPAEE